MVRQGSAYNAISEDLQPAVISPLPSAVQLSVSGDVALVLYGNVSVMYYRKGAKWGVQRVYALGAEVAVDAVSVSGSTVVLRTVGLPDAIAVVGVAGVCVGVKANSGLDGSVLTSSLAGCGKRIVPAVAGQG